MTRNLPPRGGSSRAPTNSPEQPQLDRAVIEADYLGASTRCLPSIDNRRAPGDPTSVPGQRQGNVGPAILNFTRPLAAAVDAAARAPTRAGRVTPGANVNAHVVTRAVEALRTAAPALSAGCRMWLWQYIACGLAFGAALGLVLTAPGLASTGVLVATATIFIGVSFFRVIVLAAAIGRTARLPCEAAPAPLRSGLPTYCVLVPLYREAALVPDLIDALAALDYPPAKLDVVLILEECDRATCARVARAALPPYMRFIIVPDRQPRTKPKALNMALALSRGEFVAVFDAEDVPAPDQLRKAAAAFLATPGRYACLQARLAIHNPRQSMITRQFALEYAALFHAFLPALVRLGLPLPLSGTSNHFPRAVLENALAWDPFNVTEDADLGIRLTRAGGTIGLLDSATLEEAPATPGQWLPQRTRWIKGWMQTYLVHTRRPWRLLRQLGAWRCFGFHALFAGFLVSALTYPLMLAAIGFELSRPTPFASAPGTLHRAALTVALTEAATGVLAALLTAVIGAWRGGLVRLAGHLLAAPFHWLAISVATYRALGQMIRRPHFGEKTRHTPRRRLRTALR